MDNKKTKIQAPQGGFEGRHFTPPPPPLEDTPERAPVPPSEPTHEDLIRRLVEQHETFREILGTLTELTKTIAPKQELQYYNTQQTAIATALANPPAGQPLDPNTTGYQVERVFPQLERNAPRLTAINDGTSNLYVITTPDGSTWSQEAAILPGEARTFFNVWEMRLRSPTVGVLATGIGGIYRVTEYDIWLAYTNAISVQSPAPVEQSQVHNQALPAIGADFLATALTPVHTPTTFRIMIAISIAGTLTATITNGGNTQTVTLNAVAGPALVAGGLYVFDLLVHVGDTINLRYSATGGTIQVLRMQEIDAATA